MTLTQRAIRISRINLDTCDWACRRTLKEGDAEGHEAWLAHYRRRIDRHRRLQARHARQAVAP